MSNEIESFEETKSKGAVIFIACFTGFLGLLGLLAFVNKLPYIGPDEIFLLFFAAAMIAFTSLFLRYSFRPPYLLSSRELIIRRFFRTQKFRYEDILSLGTFRKKFRPRTANGRNLNVILTTQHLVIKTRNGRERTYTLPSFGSNEQLLKSLEKRSGQAIETLPDEVEPGLDPPA